MPQLRIVGFVALLWLAHGQGAVGAITGVVRDRDGGPIPGATVTALRGSEQRKAVTNSAGRYRFDDLPLGSYRLAGGHFMFRVIGGTVPWQREPIAGIHDRMPLDGFVKALATLLSKTP
jgi:protocatechuate 3,4-dioxygenase beta subunit